MRKTHPQYLLCQNRPTCHSVSVFLFKFFYLWGLEGYCSSREKSTPNTSYAKTTFQCFSLFYSPFAGMAQPGRLTFYALSLQRTTFALCHPADPFPSLSCLPTTSSDATDLACPSSACKSCMVCISHDLLAAHARQQRWREKRDCNKEVGARSAAAGACGSIRIVPEGGVNLVP